MAHPNINRVRNRIKQEKMKGEKETRRKRRFTNILIMTALFFLYLFILNQDFIFHPAMDVLNEFLNKK